MRDWKFFSKKYLCIKATSLSRAKKINFDKGSEMMESDTEIHPSSYSHQ